MHLRRRVPLQFRQAGGSADQTRGAGLEGVVGEDGRVLDVPGSAPEARDAHGDRDLERELAPRVELHGEVLHDAGHLLVSRSLRPRRRRRGPAASGGKTIRSSRLARDPSEAVVADDRRPCVIRDYRAPCERGFPPAERRRRLRESATTRVAEHVRGARDVLALPAVRGWSCSSTSWFHRGAPRNRLKANTIRGMTEIRFGAKRNQG